MEHFDPKDCGYDLHHGKTYKKCHECSKALSKTFYQTAWNEFMENKEEKLTDADKYYSPAEQQKMFWSMEDDEGMRIRRKICKDAHDGGHNTLISHKHSKMSEIKRKHMNKNKGRLVIEGI